MRRSPGTIMLKERVKTDSIAGIHAGFCAAAIFPQPARGPRMVVMPPIRVKSDWRRRHLYSDLDFAVVKSTYCTATTADPIQLAFFAPLRPSGTIRRGGW